MKAVIPLAGKGTRLRPHTHHIPKPLVNVAGRPVMSYILDDLLELGVEEIVFVVGYLRDTIQEYIESEYPGIRGHYVVQAVQDGTAGAVKLAEEFIDEEVLILFVDTLFDADLGSIERLPADRSGIIWAKEVEDYQRFGVVVTDEDGVMTRIVEKPSEPISRLANIGLYYIRDHALLFEGIRAVVEGEPGPSGEFYLTDAFQYMVDRGSKIQTASVEGWYDCGKIDALLETNHHLLRSGRGTVSDRASVEGVEIVEPVRIEEGAVVRGGKLGPNVTVGAGTHIEDSTIRHTILGRGARVTHSALEDSIVGDEAGVSHFQGTVNVTAHSEMIGKNV